MKKTFKLLFSVLIVALAIGSFTGCKDKKLHEVKGVVTYIDADQYSDTIRSMKVLANGDTLIFNMYTADFPNGVMLDSDSVDVYYREMEGSDTLLARIVNAMPKPGKEIDLDTLKDKPLLTR